VVVGAQLVVQNITIFVLLVEGQQTGTLQVSEHVVNALHGPARVLLLLAQGLLHGHRLNPEQPLLLVVNFGGALLNCEYEQLQIHRALLAALFGQFVFDLEVVLVDKQIDDSLPIFLHLRDLPYFLANVLEQFVQLVG
jgi:hypothetical protein